MRVIAGHLCHHFGLFSGLLSTQQEIFVFAHGPIQCMRALPVGVLGELWVSQGLLFCSRAELRLKVGTTAFCSDASMKGYALMETKGHFSELVEPLRWRERWRFCEIVEGPLRDAPSVHEPRPDAVTEVGKDFADMFGAPTEDRRRAHWKLDRPSATPHTLAVVTKFPPINQSLMNPARWRLVVAGAWARGSKIHLYESKASLLALRRAATEPRQR